jgi:hypothetical protein
MGKPVVEAGVQRRVGLVGGAFWCPQDAEWTTWWFTKKPPWAHDQVMSLCTDFESPVGDDGEHAALAALCVAYFEDPDQDYLHMHPSWQTSFERARAYIEECRGEQGVPRDTFDYLFTFAF